MSNAANDEFPDLAAIAARLRELELGLNAFRDAIARGERIELAGLDREVAALCVDLVNARPDSHRFVPGMQTLIAALDGLIADLNHQHEIQA